jgi:hypothetical protein
MEQSMAIIGALIGFLVVGLIGTFVGDAIIVGAGLTSIGAIEQVTNGTFETEALTGWTVANSTGAVNATIWPNAFSVGNFGGQLNVTILTNSTLENASISQTVDLTDVSELTFYAQASDFQFLNATMNASVYLGSTMVWNTAANFSAADVTVDTSSYTGDTVLKFGLYGITDINDTADAVTGTFMIDDVSAPTAPTEDALYDSQADVVDTFVLGVTLCKILVIVSIASLVFVALRRTGLIPGGGSKY